MGLLVVWWVGFLCVMRFLILGELVIVSASYQFSVNFFDFDDGFSYLVSPSLGNSSNRCSLLWAALPFHR